MADRARSAKSAARQASSSGHGPARAGQEWLDSRGVAAIVGNARGGAVPAGRFRTLGSNSGKAKPVMEDRPESSGGNGADPAPEATPEPTPEPAGEPTGEAPPGPAGEALRAALPWTGI